MRARDPTVDVRLEEEPCLRLVRSGVLLAVARILELAVRLARCAILLGRVATRRTIAALVAPLA
jgi:hypothetical protein